jgi:hypothetical protein
LQIRLYGVDGKQDKIIAVSRDIDLNLLLTDVYTRQVDVLQNEIETDKALDHRAKIKYLTGLKIVLNGSYSGLRTSQLSAETAIQLFEAYKVYYNKDRYGIGLGQSVEQYAYPINKILLGENTVFFENPGLNVARVLMFQQFAELHPSDVLVQIEPYLDQPFADSLLIGCANLFPDKFYNYAAAAETRIGKQIRKINDPLVQLIVSISDERSGRLIFPFLHAIQKGWLTIDSVKQIAKDNLKYYRLLVKTQLEYIDELKRKDTPVLYKELATMIKRKAEELYINEINALHDLSDDKQVSEVCKKLDDMFDEISEIYEEYITELNYCKNRAGADMVKDELCGVFDTYGLVEKVCTRSYVTAVNILLLMYRDVNDNTLTLSELFSELVSNQDFGGWYDYMYDIECVDFDDESFQRTVERCLEEIYDKIEDSEEFINVSEYSRIIQQITTEYPIDTNSKTKYGKRFKVIKINPKDNKIHIAVDTGGGMGEKRSYTEEEFNNFLVSPELFENKKIF